MSIEYGIFSDESADYTEAEAIESGFYSVEDAKKAIAERYSEDDDLTIHSVEEPDDEDEDEEDEEDEDGDSESYPIKY